LIAALGGKAKFRIDKTLAATIKFPDDFTRAANGLDQIARN
jgi:hypothetical protein